MIFHANAATYMPGHALELLVPALMLLRACAVHARCAHARRRHRMGDKCTPAAPNQLLTGILALLMQSSCLFRRNTADSAACAPRYTAAQPCRPAPRMPAHSQNLAWTQNFSKSKTAAQEWSWHTLIRYKFKYFSKRQIFFVLATRIYDYLVNF